MHMFASGLTYAEIKVMGDFIGTETHCGVVDPCPAYEDYYYYY
jgi:hypothetical protein